MSDTLAALVGSNTCRVKILSCTRHKNLWSSTPVLCSESHLIFPWLKSPIIIQSPLLTSLIALCIFSLIMLGSQNTPSCLAPVYVIMVISTAILYCLVFRRAEYFAETKSPPISS